MEQVSRRQHAQYPSAPPPAPSIRPILRPRRSRVIYDMPRGVLSHALSSRMLWALEGVSVLNALVLVTILFSLHFWFVRTDACAPQLAYELESIRPRMNHESTDNGQVGTAADSDIIHIQIDSTKVETALRYAEHNVTFSAVPYEVTQQWAAAIHRTFRVSSDRGLLLLVEPSLARYNVTVREVRLGAQNRCFGFGAMRVLLEFAIGYETAVLNAVARLMQVGHAAVPLGKRAFFKNVATGAVYSISPAEMYHTMSGNGSRSFSSGNNSSPHRLVRLVTKMLVRRFGAFLTSIFMMCTVGSLVAFALKEVQLRMWKLTLELQEHMRRRAPYSAVMVRYALDALVFVPIVTGILFFMFEFFEDHMLAFAVFVVAWLCELFVILSRKHVVSLFYLPRLFFAYFLAFHLYYFTYPFGYVRIALATSVAFMQHAVLVIWNRWEFPLIRRTERHQQQQ